MPTDNIEIMRCNRCGFCQSVCPTYQNTLDETQVARGRIRLSRLVREGVYDLEKDRDLMKKLDTCLLCGACVAACPSTVATDDIVREMRRDYIQARGLTLFQRLAYRGMLSHRKRLEMVSRLIRFHEKMGLRRVLNADVFKRTLERLSYMDSFPPRPLGLPARTALPPVIHPQGRPKMKLGFFIGCASNVFTPGVVQAAVEYLSGRGAEIHLAAVNCCGEPHRAAGDFEESRRLAMGNLNSLFVPDYDFIVTDCSTCAHALRHYDQMLGPGSPEAAEVAPKLSRVTELNTLIWEHLGLDGAGLKALPHQRVTYHDSCHAIRGLGIKEAPREILTRIPGIELVEMAGADSCCGGAGSYSFTQPEMSGRIASSKVANIKAAGAGVLATSCPACLMQLGAALRRDGLDLPALHPIELLNQSQN